MKTLTRLYRDREAAGVKCTLVRDEQNNTKQVNTVEQTTDEGTGAEYNKVHFIIESQKRSHARGQNMTQG